MSEPLSRPTLRGHVLPPRRSRRLSSLAVSLVASVLTVCVVAPPALAWSGKVVGVSDGDTITVMHLGRGEKIRLYGVDTPEKSQAHGNKAKQFTSERVFGKTVHVEPIDQDRYGRTVGLVHLDSPVGRTLNEALVEAGYAWVYTAYCKRPFCATWRGLEAEARATKRGLWRDPAPTPPWEYRKRERKAPKQPGKASGPFHGNARSRVFHAPHCEHYDCRRCTVMLRTRDEALKQGFEPCGRCRP